jgi:hypothetical protein
MAAQWFARDGELTWWIVVPAITSTLAWPVVALVLGRVRYQLAVE